MGPESEKVAPRHGKRVDRLQRECRKLEREAAAKDLFVSDFKKMVSRELLERVMSKSDLAKAWCVSRQRAHQALKKSSRLNLSTMIGMAVALDVTLEVKLKPRVQGER